MIGNRNAWGKLALSLGAAFFLSFLTFVTLHALPTVAATMFPDHKERRHLLLPQANAAVFTVTGIVSNQVGTPVANVQVFAFSGVASVETFTNSGGRYTLSLTIGNFYNIVFNPPAGIGLASGFERGVHQGQILNKTLLPGHTISGTVYRDATKSQPVANVAIFVFSEDTFEGFGVPPTTANGTYQISLTPGTWGLTFTPPPFMSLGPTHTAVILTADITRDIILQPGFTVFGTATRSSGGSQPNVEIFALDPSQSSGYGFAPTDPAGSYTGTLPAGIFDIQFIPPPFSGQGSTVITNVSGPPDVPLNVMLPAGHTVSGTIRCGSGLANTFVQAAPQPPIPGDDIGGWGQFAGSDGFFALTLQQGVYNFTFDPPDSTSLPRRLVPMVVVTQDLSLNFDYCTFLPLIFRTKP